VFYPQCKGHLPSAASRVVFDVCVLCRLFCRYWELVVTARRLFMTGVIVALDRGSVTQYSAGIFVTLGSALLQTACVSLHPRNMTTDDQHRLPTHVLALPPCYVTCTVSRVFTFRRALLRYAPYCEASENGLAFMVEVGCPSFCHAKH